MRRQFLFWITGLLLVTGCASTKQFVPAASVGSLQPGNALVRVTRSSSVVGGGIPAEIRDGNTKIGTLGPSGVLTWERPAGFMLLEMKNWEDNTSLLDKVEPGKCYDFTVEWGPKQMQLTAGQPVYGGPRVKALVHPVVDARIDKGLDLKGRDALIGLPRTVNFLATRMEDSAGVFLPTDDMENLSGEKLAQLKRGDADYLIVPVVKDFHQSFRFVWLIYAEVQCSIIDLRTNKTVWQDSGKASGWMSLLGGILGNEGYRLDYRADILNEANRDALVDMIPIFPQP